MFVFITVPAPVFASGEPQKEQGIVLEVLETLNTTDSTENQILQTLSVLIVSGEYKNQTKTIKISADASGAVAQKYQVGDRVVLLIVKDDVSGPIFYVSDFSRSRALFWLFAIFAICSVAVGRLHGFTSLLGLAFSFLVIYFFIVPRILAGWDPLLTAIIGSVVILAVSLYLSHGFSRKTTVALSGIAVSLVITGFLAKLFVSAAHLTGFATDETSLLAAESAGLINMQGLLLAGILIAALGVLDDMTVSQSSIVQELAHANKTLSSRELYKRAMNVGRDHIASLTNTLVLVYAGASLPLLLLLRTSGGGFANGLNYEIVSAEIVKMLVGSVGLVLSIPITTAIAAIAHKKFETKN